MLFDLLGTMLFGVTYGAAKASDDAASSNIRQSAKENKRRTYTDVDGKIRWVDSNRKLTTEEIRLEFPSLRRTERKEPGWMWREYLEKHKEYYKEFKEKCPWSSLSFEDFLMWTARPKDMVNFNGLKEIKKKYTSDEFYNLQKYGHK